LSGKHFNVGHGFMLGLPVAAYLTWEGTLLEGNGVEPDIRWLNSPQKPLKKAKIPR